MTKLLWCGPIGHVSPTYGDLVPGKEYDVSDEIVDYLLSQPDCWQPVPVKTAVKVKDKE